MRQANFTKYVRISQEVEILDIHKVECLNNEL